MQSGLTLRPYQQDALTLMSDNRHQCEFDDMGLGKSVISLKHLERNMEETNRVLIACPVNALYVWQQEIEKWTSFKSMIYWGTPKQRSELKGILTQPFHRKPINFVICTSGGFHELLDLPWRHIICDEIHRWGLLNHKTQAYKTISKYKERVDQIIQLTGTPIRQGCIDLYAPLHITAPWEIKNYWQYVNRWCIVNETPFGKQIDRRPANLEVFRTMWRKYAVRRLTEEVKTDLPEKQRNIIPIKMTTKQAKAHKDLMTELMHYSEEEDSLTVAQNKMVAGLKARQLLVCPRLIGITEDGAALDYLKAVVPDYIFANKPVAIFTPFRDAVDIVAEVMREVCREPGRSYSEVDIYKLHGQMTPAQFGDNWTAFQQPAHKKKILICTIQSGASFHATEAATSFFLGADWDVNQNEQAEKRLHRLGQVNPVDCNYLLYEDDTVDQDIRARLNEKNQAATWILSSDEQYTKLLEAIKHG